jgi:hypothetical protein
VFEETEILVHPNGGGTPDLTLTIVVP